MTIPSLMDSIQLPNIGDIRKGSAKTADGKMGRDLNYFRFVPSVDFTQPGAVEKSNFLEDRWRAAFGDKPTSFNAFFPFAEVARNMDAWYLAFSAQGMKRKCEGPGGCVMREMVGATYVNYAPGEKPCVCAHDANMKPADRCKPTARIFLLIPQLGVAGMVVLHTTSKLDILSLYGQMMAAEALLGGRVNGVPFLFKRADRKISTPRDGQRMQIVKSLLSVHIDPSVTARRMDQFLLSGTLALPVGSGVPDSRLLVDGQHAGEYDGGQAIDVSAEDIADAERDEETERALALLREQVLEEAGKNWAPAKVSNGLRIWIDRMTKSRTSILDDLDGEELATLLAALQNAVKKKAVALPVAPVAPPVEAKAPIEEDDGDGEEGGTPAPDGDEEDGSDAGVYREIEGAAI